MSWRASRAAFFVAPELKAGWPQQVCLSGTSTVQPAASRSLMAANPRFGRCKSARQVTNRPTRGGLASGRDAFESAIILFLTLPPRLLREVPPHPVLLPEGRRNARILRSESSG